MNMLSFRRRRTDGPDETRRHDTTTAPPARGTDEIPTQRLPAEESPRAVDVDARRHARFGGSKLGAAFFGWLVAVGLTVLLSAIAGGVAAATGAAQPDAAATGLTGAIVALVILLVAYFAGGYVAGRLARFDGGRNGFLSWLIGILVTIAAAATAAIVGGATDVFRGVQMPTAPLSGEQLTVVGIVALAVTVLGTLLAAVLGGKAGERFHRKVDRFV